MGPGRLRVVLGAICVVLLLVGVVAAWPGHGSKAVHVAAEGGTVPESGAVEDAVGTTTTTVAEVTTTVPVTTTKPPTTTTPPTVTTLPTTPASTTTTTIAGPDASHTRIVIENQYDGAVHVGANDLEWVVQPDTTTAPRDLAIREQQGDGLGANPVGDQTCGTGDNDRYFYGGHTVRIVVTTGTSQCTDGSAGPKLTIYDVTAGTTRVSY
jgi:hypothetical protein